MEGNEIVDMAMANGHQTVDGKAQPAQHDDPDHTTTTTLDHPAESLSCNNNVTGEVELLDMNSNNNNNNNVAAAAVLSSLSSSSSSPPNNNDMTMDDDLTATVAAAAMARTTLEAGPARRPVQPFPTAARPEDRSAGMDSSTTTTTTTRTTTTPTIPSTTMAVVPPPPTKTEMTTGMDLRRSAVPKDRSADSMATPQQRHGEPNGTMNHSNNNNNNEEPFDRVVLVQQEEMEEEEEEMPPDSNTGGLQPQKNIDKSDEPPPPPPRRRPEPPPATVTTERSHQLSSIPLLSPALPEIAATGTTTTTTTGSSMNHHHDPAVVAKKYTDPETTTTTLLTKELQQTKLVNTELDRTIKVLREQLKTVQNQFDRQLAATAEAKQIANTATTQVQSIQMELTECYKFLKEAQVQTASAREMHNKSSVELEQVRREAEEQQRTKMVLEVRLNELKKIHVAETNRVEHYEEDLAAAHEDLIATRHEALALQRSKTHLEQNLYFAEQRVHEITVHYERLLSDEKQRNEQRKGKMKVFVEQKTDELRQAKEDCDTLQNEIAQTNRSLLDMDQRWKQLHAQWAQTQARNRELQRDLNRIKKDSENLHKQENTLEMKLSRSATETEEHKNKRLAAKHELMSVLRTLDAERDSTTKLCHRIRFTVAPRILMQHQMLNESTGELEGALNRLYLRFGKALPTTASTQSDSVDGPGAYIRQNGSHDVATAMHVDGLSNTELLSVIETIDHESERVSRIAAALSDQVEKLRGLLDSSSGDRTCFSVFSELVATGSLGTSPAALQNHATTLTRVLPVIRGRTQGYGQVPRASENS